MTDMNGNLFTGPPDHTNVEGTKWWTFDIYKGIPTYMVELTDGTRGFIATDNNEIVAESPHVGGIGFKIDVYLLLKREKVSNPSG